MEFQDTSVRRILDGLPALVAVLDDELRYRFANNAHVTWFGEDPALIVGRHFREIVGDAAFDALGRCLEPALAGHDGTWAGEVPFVSGGYRFIHATSSAVQTDEKRLILFLATDVSDLKNAQTALSASTRRSETVLDTAVDAIITIDERGIIQSCNASCVTMLGFDRDELVGNNVKMLMPELFASQHDGYLRRYMETREKRIIGIGREIVARRKDGTEFPAHLAVGEFEDRGRHFFTGFIRDMTAQKEAEQQARRRLEELAHVTRLSAIDNLASGIAHEVNQPLTAIVTMSQALLRSMRAGNADAGLLQDTLERIVNQGARATSILRQMRELTRKGATDERLPHSMEDVVENVLRLFDHEIGHYGIEVRMNPAGGKIMAQIDRIQIEQVLLNLIQNAVYAMMEVSGERILTIDIRLALEPESGVEISVSDTGVGLPPDGRDHVFDPFYTTREQGMGQGLSISRSIVESHGGVISAGDNEAGGAVFRFTLPAHV